MIRILALSLLLVGGLAAAEELLPLRTRAQAKIILANGEEAPGEVVKVLDDGTVVFKQPGETLPVRYQREQYRRLVLPLSATQILTQRHAILLAPEAGDQSVELLRTLRWGIEQIGADEDARAALHLLAIATLERYPGDVRIADETLKLLKDDPQYAQQLETMIRNTLTASPSWSEGYQVLSQMLLEQNRQPELVTLVDEWLKRQPTNYQANLMMARHAEATGQLNTAREAYYKALTYHKDMDAGLGYARLSLSMGRLEDAGKAAQTLAEAGVHTLQAKAILGVVLVHQGADEAAIASLTEALDSGQLSEAVAQLANYNLGLALYRSGETAAAVSRWQTLDSPESRLAVAIAQRTAVDLKRIPEGRLKSVARELNACLNLEAKRYDQARKDLDGGISERHLFLNHLSDMLAASGSLESVRTVATHQGAESLHWQVYGHLLAQRFDQAQDLLDRLPEDDGYAAVCRIYVAEGRGEQSRARQLFEALDQAQGAPQQYVAKLADRFGAENDELRNYDFDWPEGFSLSEGWSARNAGTGILVKAEKGQLVIEGTQTPSPDPVSRAWCLVSPAKLASATVTLDTAAVASATVGIELLDEQQANGIAYGIQSDGSLAWRQRDDGQWGGWHPLDQQVQGRNATLTLDYDHRFARILAVVSDKQQVVIGKDVRLASPYLCVAVFGESEPGVTWRLAVDQVTLQLKPLQQAGAPAAAGGTRSRRGAR